MHNIHNKIKIKITHAKKKKKKNSNQPVSYDSATPSNSAVTVQFPNNKTKTVPPLRPTGNDNDDKTTNSPLTMAIKYGRNVEANRQLNNK